MFFENPFFKTECQDMDLKEGDKLLQNIEALVWIKGKCTTLFIHSRVSGTVCMYI